MKRRWEPDESGREEGQNYIQHGGKFDGSMKSSLFHHVMDVTDEMFKIPDADGFKNHK